MGRPVIEIGRPTASGNANATVVPNPTRASLREVASLFFRLGLTAFGGPAGATALMRDEVVRRRRWVTEQRFLDLLGVSNIIPGPSATELAMFLGRERAGWLAFGLAGLLYILPSTAIVLALAWSYVRFGATPQAIWILAGVKPVIVAVLVQAVWGLGRSAVKGPFVGIVGVAAFVLYLFGLDPIVLLLAAGAVVLLVRNAERLRQGGAVALGFPGLAIEQLALGAIVPAMPFSLGLLFVTCLKIGALLFGGGYVLIALLRPEFVEGLGWVSDAQLLDAVAVGQITPGPLSTAATFLGYLVGGVPGALVATAGIFLPSFAVAAVASPAVSRLRGSVWTSAFLDGVNVAAVALMAGVTWQLGRIAIIDWPGGAAFVVAAVLLLKFRAPSVYLVIVGAVLGLLRHLLAA